MWPDRDYDHPQLVRHERFTARPITIDDAIRNYAAVMASRPALWEMFGAVWRWPAEDLTLAVNIVHEAWHQRETDLRRAFYYTLVDPSENYEIGCLYIDRAVKAGADADVTYWVRTDEPGEELEPVVDAWARRWLTEDWPFERVRWPGRDVSWTEWSALPSALVPR
ncbi:N-acetyltransferase [Streptomyces umbrinus]|uniref:N-acetyltransferase n=1 Tax=Streptomyces umbrinus TaxID=67370 RepID=UPI00340DE342